MTDWSAETLVGGHLSLDFLNTAGGRTKARDAERLRSYEDAVTWALRTEALAVDEADELTALAHVRGSDASRALEDLHDQREALHAFLLAGLDEVEPHPEVRARVESDLQTAYASARLSASSLMTQPWSIPLLSAEMNVIGRRVALSTGALLISDERHGIRICQACSWMYLDLSPTRRRRWCSMAACGNRTKVQRHYRKSRSETTGE